MKTETKLARVFHALGEQEKRTETTAAAVLTIVKSAKINTVEEFDPVVYAAYEANGWNARPGRPAGDAEPKDDVPSTVRTYVTWLRTALREGLNLKRFGTFYELREAVRAKHAAQAAPRPATRTEVIPAEGPPPMRIDFVPARVKPDIEGIAYTAGNVALVNGSEKGHAGLFKNLLLIYANVPAATRREMREKLVAIVNEYREQAMPRLEEWQKKLLPPPAKRGRRAAAAQ